MGGVRFAIRDDAVTWAPADDDSVIVLDLRTSKYLTLNSAGSVLWRALDTGATTDELAAVLVDRFHIADERAATDVDSFLRALTSREMIAEC